MKKDIIDVNLIKKTMSKVGFSAESVVKGLRRLQVASKIRPFK